MNKNIALNDVSNKVDIIRKGMNDKVDNEGGKTDLPNLIVRMVLHILFYGALLFVVVSVADKAYEFAYQIYGDVSVAKESTHTREIEVLQGDSVLTIASKLYNEKLIVDKYSFVIRLKLSGEVVQQGKYTISNDMNYKEIIEEITMIKGEDEES